MDESFKNIILSQLNDHDLCLKDINKSINNVSEKVELINTALVGYKNRGGLLKDVEEIEKQVESLNKAKVQIITAFVTIQAIGGIIFSIIMKFMRG